MCRWSKRTTAPGELGAKHRAGGNGWSFEMGRARVLSAFRLPPGPPGEVAQLAEQRSYISPVGGSSPPLPTIWARGGMADATGLSPVGRNDRAGSTPAEPTYL